MEGGGGAQKKKKERHLQEVAVDARVLLPHPR